MMPKTNNRLPINNIITASSGGVKKNRINIKQFYLRIISVLKLIIIYFFYITVLSLGVGLAGLIGYFIAIRIPILLIIPILFFVGFCIFLGVLFIRNKIKKTERLKSEFITVAAHRLRTPLTRIEWMLSGLSESISSIQGKETIDSMKETLDNLVKATNRLLEATEVGKSSLYYNYLFEKSKFVYTVQQVVADYAVGARKKNIRVSFSIEENLPWTYIDKERMYVVIGALVENAIIYTPANGTVSIEVYKKNNLVFFSITDNGIGIEKDALPYMFTKFFRTKDAVSVDRDRAGLGLFIAKEIIEKHGGNIWAESKGKDKGSHFWFSLPAHS